MYKFLRLSNIDYIPIRKEYLNNVELFSKTYEQQHNYFRDRFLFWPGDYEYYLTKMGYCAEHIICNGIELQKKWAKEHNILSTGMELLIEQIKYYKPTVLFIQSPEIFENHVEVLNNLKNEIKSLKLIIAFRCAPMVNYFKVLENVDLTLTCTEYYLNIYRNLGLKTELLQHGFDARILTKINNQEKIDKIAFSGNIVEKDQFHMTRKDIINNFIQKGIELDIYSDIANFRLQDYIKTGKYGLEYFHLLSQYLVNLNIHIDTSGDYAGNMRMFEVAGMGSCLLTDYKSNLSSFFELGYEIETFSSKDEAIEKAQWLLNNKEKTKDIGANAQRKVLKQYTLKNRVEELDMILKKYLK